jgi:hypothetical protein
LIYISHEYGGKQENIDKVELLVRTLSKIYPYHTFVSPIHAFGFMYEDAPYEIGMRYCLDLLSKCSLMWVFENHSRGVEAEIKFCEEHDIPWSQIV